MEANSLFRVRVGDSWKQNPEYRASLVALAEGRSQGFSPRHIVDSIRIEVDGIDVTGGVLQLPLVDALRQLHRAARNHTRHGTAAALLPSDRDAALEVSGGEGTAVLRLRTAPERGSPIEIEVDSEHFVAETRRAALALHRDFVAVSPLLADNRIVHGLFEETRRSPITGRTSRSTVLEFEKTVEVANSRLAIRNGRKTLHLLDHMGKIEWSGGSVSRAAPLLQRFVISGDSLLPELSIAWQRSTDTWTLGRSRPVPRLAVLAAFRELLSTEFPLTSPSRSVSSPLRLVPKPPTSVPQAPALPESGLRRVSFRRKWSARLEGQYPQIDVAQAEIIGRTLSSVDVFSLDGERLWSTLVDSPQLVRRGDESLIVGARDSRELLLFRASSGELVSRVFAGFVRGPRSAHGLERGDVVVQDDTRLIALGDGPEPAWTLDLRERFHIVSCGASLVALTSSGVMLGISADGAPSWRLETPLRTVESVDVDAATGLILATGRDDTGFHLLVTARFASGEAVLERRVVPGWISQPTIVGGRIVFARRPKSKVALIAIDPASGRGHFEVTLPFDSGVSVQHDELGLWVGAAGGAWAHLNVDGATLTQHPARDPDTALSPRQPRPLLLMAKVVVSIGTHLHVAERATGRPLATLEPGELAPVSSCLADGPLVVTAGSEGLVEAWVNRGHLGVVPSAFSREEL